MRLLQIHEGRRLPLRVRRKRAAALFIDCMQLLLLPSAITLRLLVAACRPGASAWIGSARWAATSLRSAERRWGRWGWFAMLAHQHLAAAASWHFAALFAQTLELRECMLRHEEYYKPLLEEEMEMMNETEAEAAGPPGDEHHASASTAAQQQ